MIGLYAELQVVGFSFINQIQGDYQDVAMGNTISQESMLFLNRVFLDMELLRAEPAYQDTMVQLMMKQLQLPLQLLYGDGQVISLGWKPDPDRLPG